MSQYTSGTTFERFFFFNILYHIFARNKVKLVFLFRPLRMLSRLTAPRSSPTLVVPLTGVEGRRCLSCFAPPLPLSLIGLVLRPGSGSLLELLILLATDLEFEASMVTDLV